MTLPCPNCKNKGVEKEVYVKRGRLFDEMIGLIYREKYHCPSCKNKWYINYTDEGEMWYEKPEDEEMFNEMQELED